MATRTSNGGVRITVTYDDREVVSGAQNTEKTLKTSLGNAKKHAADFAKGLTLVTGAITALAVGTREFREDLSRLDVAFEDVGASSEDARKTFQGMYGILGETDVAIEASNHLAELTQNTKELADWNIITAGVAAKFGDSLPIEGLTEAANETAKLGQVTGPLADALNWAGISEEEFNAQLARTASESQRATIITKTLAKTYGDAGSAFLKANEDIIASREATLSLEMAMAELGAVAEPIVASLTMLLADLVQAFVDNQEVMVPLLATILGVVAGYKSAMIIISVIEAFKILSQTIPLVTAAQKLLNLAMNANPVGLVITAIAGLVAIFMHFWETSEGFREFWIGLWEGAVDVAKAAGKGLADIFKGVVNGIISTINAPAELLNWLIDGLNSIQIDIPDWIPKFGGETFGFNIPKLPTIPKLASGAVLPPNNPFIAIVGDQKHGTNVEAPLSTIEDALRNVLGEGGSGETTEIYYLNEQQLAKFISRLATRGKKILGV